MPNFNIDWKERRSKVKIYTDSMQALMILTDYQGFERKKLGGWVVSGLGQKVYRSPLKMDIEC